MGEETIFALTLKKIKFRMPMARLQPSPYSWILSESRMEWRLLP